MRHLCAILVALPVVPRSRIPSIVVVNVGMAKAEITRIIAIYHQLNQTESGADGWTAADPPTLASAGRRTVKQHESVFVWHSAHAAQESSNRSL